MKKYPIKSKRAAYTSKNSQYDREIIFHIAEQLKPGKLMSEIMGDLYLSGEVSFSPIEHGLLGGCYFVSKTEYDTLQNYLEIVEWGGPEIIQNAGDINNYTDLVHPALALSKYSTNLADNDPTNDDGAIKSLIALSKLSENVKLDDEGYLTSDRFLVGNLGYEDIHTHEAAANLILGYHYSKGKGEQSFNDALSFYKDGYVKLREKTDKDRDDIRFSSVVKFSGLISENNFHSLSDKNFKKKYIDDVVSFNNNNNYPALDVFTDRVIKLYKDKKNKEDFLYTLDSLMTEGHDVDQMKDDYYFFAHESEIRDLFYGYDKNPAYHRKGLFALVDEGLLEGKELLSFTQKHTLNCNKNDSGTLISGISIENFGDIGGELYSKGKIVAKDFTSSMNTLLKSNNEFITDKNSVSTAMKNFLSKSSKDILVKDKDVLKDFILKDIKPKVETTDFNDILIESYQKDVISGKDIKDNYDLSKDEEVKKIKDVINHEDTTLDKKLELYSLFGDNMTEEEQKSFFSSVEITPDSIKALKNNHPKLFEDALKYREDLRKAVAEDESISGEERLKLMEKYPDTFGGKDAVKNKRDEMLKNGEIPVTDTEMEPAEFEVNGEKIKMDFTATGWYDKILNFSFKNNKSDAKEIVDVVSEYGWMNNTTNKNTSSDFIKHNNIPYCYAVEYRQLYNASISNIILSFLGLAYSAKGAASGVYNLAGSAIDGIINLSSPLVKLISGAFSDDNSNSNKSTTLPPQDGGQTTGEKNTSERKESWLDKAGRTINSWANKGDEYFRGAMEKVAYLDSRGPIATGRKSGLLNPYRMMYILSKTDKQYCFPMLDKSASSYKVSNKMDEADGGQGSRLLGNRFFGMVANLAQTVLGIAQDINQIAPFFQSAIGNADNIKSMRQYHIERSKFFSFPTDGEDIEVSFILFNTVKKNIWKKHFNFIFGFVLRNLPFKHDLVSYYPPLFYDVIVPGVKRCPYCYVERIDVSPLGLMRNMSVSSEDIGLPNLTNGGGKMNYTVNVPEAWQVKIVFKSLIATSGNQILSGFVDMPIQASSSNDSLKNKNENKK